MPEPKNLHVDQPLTTFAQQYQNEEFIASQVLPIVKVAKRSDVYYKYDKDERFTIPDTKIGPKSRANGVDWSVSTDNYSVKDFGLEDFVSQAEIDNADAPLRPEQDSVDFLMELLMLDYEKRVADLVFASGTYPAANRTTLAGANQWTDKTNSDPIKDIMLGLDTAFLRPNIMVIGADSWRALRQHPKIIDSVKGATRNQGAKGGIASREDVASLFELEKVLVGRSRLNNAKKGQTASYLRLWTDNCALLRVLPRPGVRTVTFGCAFSEMLPSVMTWEGPEIGVKGGRWVKASWNSDEKIKASDLGYLISDTNA